MFPIRAFRGSWAAAATLLLLAACANQPESLSGNDPYARHAAEEVFAAGFENIVEKYIEPVTMDSVGVEGLRGLGSVDPAITVGRDGEELVFRAGGEVFARRAAPAAGDTRAWGLLAAEVTLAARQRSMELRLANEERIYEAVFDGALSHLDVFSRYAGAEEARRNRDKRDGFGGIGIKFRLVDGVAEVTEVIPDTPAAEAGILAGDRITHVGAVPLDGLSVSHVVDQLHGPVGSRVSLTMLRRDETPVVLDVERSHIVPVTVTAERMGDVGLLRISSFNQNTARSVAESLHDLRTQGPLAGLILDLRGNPGGLLRQAIKVSDLLLTQGQIVSTRGRHPDSLHNYEAGGRDLGAGLPLIVLVDGKSASAAEIVAAALQDRGRGIVLGATSFGKGTVQTVIRLPNDGEITLTWSRLIAPSGYTLHGLGVLPAVCTSDDRRSSDEILQNLRKEPVATGLLFEEWRRPVIHSLEERREMRAGCPSRPGRERDIELARRLLAESDLYARVLNVSTSTAAAAAE